MDAFVSYKWKDAKTFASLLVERLKRRRLSVWQDDLDIKPGQSVIRGIESGLAQANLLILVLSKQYFSGWSDMERNAIMHLYVSNRRKIFPIWLDVDYQFILRSAPLLADIKGFEATGEDVPSELVESIMYASNPDYVESKLIPLTDSELPPLPEEYTWYFGKNLNVAIAKPKSWFSKELAQKGDRVIALSKEDVDITRGRYETGLTLNVNTNVSKRFGLPADIFSLNLFRTGLSGSNYEIRHLNSTVLNGIETQSVVMLIKDPGLPDVLVRSNSFGVNAIDMAFSVHWDTILDKYSDVAKAIADVMLSHVAFAYDD